MSFALAVLPMVLVVSAGYLIARSGMIARDSWGTIETLSFRILIPAVLILAIARADLSLARFGGLIAAVVGTLAIGGIAILAMSFTRMANGSLTTLFQTTLRWNAFVGLAAADQFAAGDLTILAVCIAVSIPTINIACILVLASLGPSRATLTGIAKTVATNPLIQACVIGLAINLSGVALPIYIVETLDLIGRAALGIGLMAVGAGISLRRLARINLRVLIGAAARPVLMPLVFLMLAKMLGLSAAQAFAGLLVFASPAATNGYIVAKKMGGDAPLYADVLSWQTILSLAILPIWAAQFALVFG